MIDALSHHHAVFDTTAMILRHEVVDRQAQAGLLINFLNVAVDPDIYPEGLLPFAGTVEGPPLPANWHADIAEWAAALRAVELSTGNFRMIELGCGWGCWMTATGAAARRLGRDLDLIGVEGDPDYLRFAEQALERNGFGVGDWTLHQGVAAATGGIALFPKQDVDGRDWGIEPILGASIDQQADAARIGSHNALPMLSLIDVIGDRSRIDLLHIDIQGGELDLIERSLDLLAERVAYIVVGTHSRQIEGRLFDALLSRGWVLEVERPAILNLEARPSQPVIVVDGLQGWRNPLLT